MDFPTFYPQICMFTACGGLMNREWRCGFCCRNCLKSLCGYYLENRPLFNPICNPGHNTVTIMYNVILCFFIVTRISISECLPVNVTCKPLRDYVTSRVITTATWVTYRGDTTPSPSQLFMFLMFCLNMKILCSPKLFSC